MSVDPEPAGRPEVQRLADLVHYQPGTVVVAFRTGAAGGDGWFEQAGEAGKDVTLTLVVEGPTLVRYDRGVPGLAAASTVAAAAWSCSRADFTAPADLAGLAVLLGVLERIDELRATVRALVGEVAVAAADAVQAKDSGTSTSYAAITFSPSAVEPL